MQEVPDHEHDWYSNTKEAEDSEYNHTAGFESPRCFLPEVSGERQIESRNRNEEQSEEDLLYSWRE